MHHAVQRHCLCVHPEQARSTLQLSQQAYCMQCKARLLGVNCSVRHDCWVSMIMWLESGGMDLPLLAVAAYLERMWSAVGTPVAAHKRCCWGTQLPLDLRRPKEGLWWRPCPLPGTGDTEFALASWDQACETYLQHHRILWNCGLWARQCLR